MDIRYQHQVYRGSSRLVIFIHGFAGAPQQFEDFFPVIDEFNYDYCSIWVPGHGGSTLDFAKTNASEWLQCAIDVIKEKRNHYNKIIVVAHSMGCLLTMNALQQVPVDGLVFWAPAIQTSLSPKQIGSSLEILFKSPDKLDPYNQKNTSKMGVPVPTILEAPLWTPRLISFLKIMVTTRKLVSTIACPTLVITSKKDETVPWKVVRQYQKRVPPDLLTTKVLDTSYHAFFTPQEIPVIQQLTREFMNQFNTQGE